jgi:hypothetical protein
MLGRMVAPRPQPEEHDRGITVENRTFIIAAGVIRSKMSAMNCVDDSGSPWRSGTRTDKTGLWW